ncbi:MAG: hypothetical protein RIF46_02885 [Cyclobacteriaceae bacterium]
MKLLILIFLAHSTMLASAQEYPNEPSSQFPFGRPHPDGPKELADFEPMIGICKCKSVSRISQTEWADTVMMEWKFRYIMDGWAVQDETLKADGAHSGSIRIFNADSARWYVHYYSNAPSSGPLGVWEGNKSDGKIKLYQDSPAPNGTPGYYRLTFSDFSEDGYNWVGEWVDKTETFSYPTWKIFCKRDE